MLYKVSSNMFPYSFYSKRRAYNSLFNGLVAVYGFDDAGDLGKDSINRRPLTKINAPTWTSDGKLLGALSTNVTNWMNATNHEFAIRPNYTNCYWVKFTSFASTSTVWFGQSSQATVFIDSGGGNYRLRWSLFNSDTSTYLAIVQSSINLSLDTWYFITQSYDGSDYSLQVNNGTPDIVSTASYYTSPSVSFRIGGIIQPTFFDEISIWHRILTSDEKSAIYNGGIGRRFPYF